MAEPEQQTFRLAIGQAKVLEFVATTAPTASVASDSMRFRLRDRRGTLLIEKSTGSGITCTEGDPDVISTWEVLLNENDTFGRATTDPVTPTDLSPGLYNWSFWNVDDGEEHPKAFGTCTLYRTAETG
jgi:hypothetical protein